MDRNDIAISEWRDSKTRKSAATLKVALKAEGLPLFVLSLVIFYQNCFRSARRRSASGLDLPSAPEAPFWPFAHRIGRAERFCEVAIEIHGPPYRIGPCGQQGTWEARPAEPHEGKNCVSRRLVASQAAGRPVIDDSVSDDAAHPEASPMCAIAHGV